MTNGRKPVSSWTSLQECIFLDRYALKDPLGNLVERQPEEMWWRVASAIAAAEPTEEKRRLWADRFNDAMRNFRFVPGGRILAGAGTGRAVTYYNCFVLPEPEDSRAGILDNLKLAVEIMARGGGFGLNLSSLRPRGSHIASVNGTSSGPCAWAELYSVATGDVIQQGGSRRGAAMLMLDDSHPDVEEFVTAKRRPGVLEHANLSVCVSDAFMDALACDADWNLVWNGKIHKTVRARQLWNQICESAWASAEPGVVFIDRYNKLSNTWYYENIRCVNPCGEEGLPPFGVCNLGALNLAAFVDQGQVDYDGLAEHARIAIRFLDDVVDASSYFLEENRRAQLGTRRTGLGTMGLADVLLLLGVRYGSDASLEVIERIHRTIRDAAYDASSDLAVEKGAFPRFDSEKYLQGEFIAQLPSALQDKIARQGIRNAVLLAQAPTGTTSLLAGVSSGIEPIFDFEMVRRDRLGEHVISHPLAQRWHDDHPGSPLPEYFVTAADLSPEEHVMVQATIQRYVDASISKTVNAPNRHTVREVDTLYRLAYQLGCKGVTYYREGSRDAVLTHANSTPATTSVTTRALPQRDAVLRPRPRVLAGATYRAPTPVGTVFVTINGDDKDLAEVFVTVGRAGSDVAADAEAIGRLISLAFRIPSSLSTDNLAEAVIDQLSGIGGSSSLGFGGERVRSLADGVAKVLRQHLTMRATGGLEKAVGDAGRSGEVERIRDAVPRVRPSGDFCPRCGQGLVVHEEGCQKCHACGYSAC
ncbi:MAG TPA: adenosylcobalamin-dependent ribonucleoside-diphosphate reductase [Candidatus Saccharimonadales bacterium]|nr:adenosylcobalamin-dependent ribonucleoside-diphosphate reductase [Candidatus Saccharimonadales bacterium]